MGFSEVLELGWFTLLHAHGLLPVPGRFVGPGHRAEMDGMALVYTDLLEANSDKGYYYSSVFPTQSPLVLD